MFTHCFCQDRVHTSRLLCVLICRTVKKKRKTSCQNPPVGLLILRWWCNILCSHPLSLSPSPVFRVAHTRTHKHAYMILQGNLWPQANKTQPNSGGRALRETNTTQAAHSVLTAWSFSVMTFKRLFPHQQGCKVGFGRNFVVSLHVFARLFLNVLTQSVAGSVQAERLLK